VKPYATAVPIVYIDVSPRQRHAVHLLQSPTYGPCSIHVDPPSHRAVLCRLRREGGEGPGKGAQFQSAAVPGATRDAVLARGTRPRPCAWDLLRPRRAWSVKKYTLWNLPLFRLHTTRFELPFNISHYCFLPRLGLKLVALNPSRALLLHAMAYLVSPSSALCPPMLPALLSSSSSPVSSFADSRNAIPAALASSSRYSSLDIIDYTGQPNPTTMNPFWCNMRGGFAG